MTYFHPGLSLWSLTPVCKAHLALSPSRTPVNICRKVYRIYYHHMSAVVAQMDWLTKKLLLPIRHLQTGGLCSNLPFSIFYDALVSQCFWLMMKIEDTAPTPVKWALRHKSWDIPFPRLPPVWRLHPCHSMEETQLAFTEANSVVAEAEGCPCPWRTNHSLPLWFLVYVHSD